MNQNNRWLSYNMISIILINILTLQTVLETAFPAFYGDFTFMYVCIYGWMDLCVCMAI